LATKVLPTGPCTGVWFGASPGQRSAWTPDSSIHSNNWWNSGRALAIATWLTTLLGWATAVLITAGFTQAIKQE